MQPQETVSKQSGTRTPYRTPKLVRYGQLASLTAGAIVPQTTEGTSSGSIVPL